jgi:two-component system, OmpR family, catabolic regulation response regulator CreB
MPHHILIVEDELAIVETLVYAFNEAGFTTTHKALGSEAIVALGNTKVDFVILDIGLPDMTGFDVCKQIRAISNIPILFLTARNHEIDRIVGLEIGADDYVTKPFSPREVVARVKTILRRTELSPVKISNQFSVDEIANRVTYDGQYLELTRYEFLLLKTLVKHPQRVYSRAQLMDIVWANAENTLERTVDAHVKTLRAKLRQINGESQAIVTHRGMGYSLLA